VLKKKAENRNGHPMMKRSCVIATVFLLLGAVSIFGLPNPSSNYYQLEPAAFSAGGRAISTGSYQIVFQGAAPFASGHSTSGKGVYGTHFSSHVRRLAGFNQPFDKGLVGLDALVHGTVTSKVQFSAALNGGAWVDVSPQTEDINAADGWVLPWSSGTEVSVTKSVQIKARAYDGLGWGPWYTSEQTFILDNETPVINAYSDAPSSFSPSISYGIKDETVIDLDFSDSFFKKWSVNVYRNSDSELVRNFTQRYKISDSYVTTRDPSTIPGLEVWLDAADVSTIVKDGSGYVSRWKDKSGNGHHAYQSILSNRPQYVGSALANQGVLRFDDVNDYLKTNYFSYELVQPNTIFIVGREVGSNNGYFVDGLVDGKRHSFLTATGTGDFGITAGAAAWRPELINANYNIHSICYDGKFGVFY